MNELRRLMQFSQLWRFQMILGIILSVLVILSNVALLALSGWFITSMALAGMGTLSLEFFTPAAAIRGLAVLRTFARYLERLVTHDATLQLVSLLRVWFYQHLAPLAPARLHNFRDGDLLVRLRTDLDNLDNFYLRILFPAISGLISSIIILSALLWFSPGIAMIDAITLFFAGVVIPLVVVSLTKNSGNTITVLQADFLAAFTDFIRGFGELQVAGAVSRQKKYLSEYSKKIISEQRKQFWIGAFGNALSSLIGQIGMFGTFVFLVTIKATTGITASESVMLIFAVLASTEAITALPMAFSTLSKTREAAHRIFSIAELTPVLTLPETSKTPDCYDLTFSEVTMRYNPKHPVILETLSFHVPEGKCLAILGPNGAGKTTILNLIQGFWGCEKGSVSIGGSKVQELSDEVLRRMISVVSQQSHLFNASIRDNLRLVAPDASDDTLWEALRLASMAKEVHLFPNGLDTLVGELGTRLSGGQVRRIAIARAFLSHAPIVLLDEPTEGLDATNTDIVINSLKKLVKGKTTLLITHQLQPLALADSQLVLSVIK
ncbi:TPA: thiol reductant ABC exporter subunit CydC [Klebsiella pneumoniae]|uniref:Thiol reductant ABC exporter subunit CydC n=1 Tax=Salmonella enterica TaxID=28901 RepID=A0A7H0RWS6_SALER|nr:MULTISPECIES: thiol reductant ABC exporter subunit CydC [Enterobacteriaceae]ECA5023916.1 thiol reductant ABC exporter subunit CydC [Salmonella enterica subsp. enterica serovar Ohio]ECE8812315.1 thiol reductant ABC exporter subunit CydC [Salmonella enterica subsp. enterica serovar Virchow]EDX3259298.1 thiol reductant ABC exporter subunit CydC [Salmonella enterica subsp. enterica serovar Mbandaka]EHX8394587.1 thiol reductant ABC exporter subunit CydC [Salmonella enterica subsp. enterica serova